MGKVCGALSPLFYAVKSCYNRVVEHIIFMLSDAFRAILLDHLQTAVDDGRLRSSCRSSILSLFAFPVEPVYSPPYIVSADGRYLDLDGDLKLPSGHSQVISLAVRQLSFEESRIFFFALSFTLENDFLPAGDHSSFLD